MHWFIFYLNLKIFEYNTENICYIYIKLIIIWINFFFINSKFLIIIINDYSIRKLEDIYYLSKILYPKIYQDIPNKNSSRNLKKKENNKIKIDNNENITIINESEVKPKFNNILERLQKLSKRTFWKFLFYNF